jgi:hypothetical protein
VTAAPTDVTLANGRVWLYRGLGSVTRRDGGERRAWRFQTACRACGRPFEMLSTSPRPRAGRSGPFDLVHCPAHRLRYPPRKPKPVAERIRLKSGQMWTLVDRLWYRNRRGVMLRMGLYHGTCFACGQLNEATAKLHRAGRKLSSYLRTLRCRACRDLGHAVLV